MDREILVAWQTSWMMGEITMPIQIGGITVLQVQQKFYIIGCHFGAIHIMEGNTIETVISEQNVWTKVTEFDSNGLSNNATPDIVNSRIIINDPGVYSIQCTLGCESSGIGGADKFEFEIQKNEGTVRLPHIHAIREMRAGGGGDWASVSLTPGMANLAVNDSIELWVKNTESTDNILIVTGTLLLSQEICKEMI